MAEQPAETINVEPQAEEVPLSTVVRDTLKRSGELNKIRALIQSKVLEVVRHFETDPITTPPEDEESDTPREILNKLILEYFHWAGLIYSADLLASECGMDPQPPSRMNLENFLDCDYEKGSPILLSLVDGLMRQNN